MTFTRNAALLATLALAFVAQAGNPDSEWHHYGHDPGGARYSPLDQINRDNVGALERA